MCTKQGFTANEYDLKHHNNVLDTTSIIRFTGLPNNAQLEMCTIQRARRESSVTLGVQLENGSRLTGEFNPVDSLWDVVQKLCPEEGTADNNLVIIYMRNEVYGLEALQRTNLRSLGLTGGRAMVRLVHRSPEELRTQANVSALLPAKPVEEKPYVRRPKQQESTGAESLAPDTDTSGGPRTEPQQQNYVADFIKKEKSKGNKKCAPKSKTSEAMEVDEAVVEKAPSKKEDSRTIEDFVFVSSTMLLVISI